MVKHNRGNTYWNDICLLRTHCHTHSRKYGWKEGILESKRVARRHVGAPVYLTEKGGWVDAGLGKVAR